MRILNKIFGSGILAISTSAAPALGQEEPVHVEVVTKTLKKTLDKIWLGFIEQLPFIVAGVIVLLLTWIGVLLFTHFGRRILRRFRLRPSLQELAIRLSVIMIWILGVLLAATIIFPDLTPTRALGAMGIASLAVGFAFKDIFENFFAGVLILWRFPFENGDYIECEGVEGQVVDVTIRMTMVRRMTGELVVVPNSFLFKNPVEVYNDRPLRRISIIAGIAYGESVSEAVRVIAEAVGKCSSVLPAPAFQVFPHGFGESSIDIEITWWTAPRPVDLRRSRGEVVTAVKEALDAAGIEIPFPYRTLVFKEALQARVRHEGDGAP